MLIAADHTPFAEQNPARKHQIPVIFRILFNCGLRTSELLKLRMCDVDLKENVFTILDTKFHKTVWYHFRFGFGGPDSISGNVPTTISDSLIFPVQALAAMVGGMETVGCKLNSTSFSEWQGFLIMVQEKVHGFMISGTPLQYTA